MNTLNDKDLQKLQAVQNQLLQDFKNTCEKHNLKYTLHAGTLLGAARHQGFIPWDDDVDVCMPREDYNKYISLSKTDIGSDNFLLNYHTDPKFVHTFTRLSKQNTVAVQNHWRNAGFQQAIFIDVFPLDPLPKNDETIREQATAIDKIANLKRIKARSALVSRKPGRPIGNVFVTIIKHLMFVSLLPTSMEKLNRKQENISIKNNETGKIASFSEGVYSIITREQYLETDFDDMTQLSFEGVMYNVPKEYQRILTSQYGDYMQLPDEKDRVGHHNFSKIEF